MISIRNCGECPVRDRCVLYSDDARTEESPACDSMVLWARTIEARVVQALWGYPQPGWENRPGGPGQGRKVLRVRIPVRSWLGGILAIGCTLSLWACGMDYGTNQDHEEICIEDKDGNCIEDPVCITWEDCPPIENPRVAACSRPVCGWGCRNDDDENPGDGLCTTDTWGCYGHWPLDQDQVCSFVEDGEKIQGTCDMGVCIPFDD